MKVQASVYIREELFSRLDQIMAEGREHWNRSEIIEDALSEWIARYDSRNQFRNPERSNRKKASRVTG